MVAFFRQTTITRTVRHSVKPSSPPCGLSGSYPGSVLLVGAEPKYPEVEYGWIEPGRTLEDSRSHSLHRVSRFWEKPTQGYAEVLQRRGCLWNTFVMVGLAGTFLELLNATVPHLTEVDPA